MNKRTEPRLAQDEPVRIFGMDSQGHPIHLATTTFDVSKSGARLKGLRCWDYPGEIIGVRHGLEKARFRIVWVGHPGTPLDGQIGLQCLEVGRYIWGVMPPSSDREPASLGSGSLGPGSLGLGGRNQPRAFASQMAISQASGPGPDRRRRDQRFTSAGGVNVREVGTSVPQWTMLHDISAGGCYVETTSPLLPQTRVELTLQMGDLRIECKGSVTVKHPLVGMGIKFGEMTPLNRDRLLHLITSLEEESAKTAGRPY